MPAHALSSATPLPLPLPLDAAAAPPRGGTDSRGRIRQLLITSFFGDALAIIAGLTLAGWLRFETPLERFGSADSALIVWTDYFRHIVFGSALYLLLLSVLRLYAAPGMLRLRQSCVVLLKAATAWLLAHFALGALLRPESDVSRLYVFLGAGCVTLSLFAWRRAYDLYITRIATRDQLHRRILFVGWSGPAAAFVDAIISLRDPFFEIAGCVPAPSGRYAQTPPARVRRLGDYSQLHSLLTRHQVDMVVMADMSVPAGETIGLVDLCEKEMIDFKIIPNCFQILLSGLHLENTNGVPVLGLTRLPLDNPFNLAAKETLDVLGGLLGLLLSAPLIALFGYLVHRESPGPVLYTQTRLGRGGRHFRIVKIRSMRLDAELSGRPGWSVKDDPRRLRIGAFMRRWNIDELPQFWNVLKGDMSLVGPRPERPELIIDFKEAIPHYNARHNIKPGITGWAQVKGFRGDTDLRERIRCDLHYIEQWSLFLDLQILLMTLFSRKNAC
jgi:exopolysaccharide biosynthesis polyprenyl glycosylphosphotransferase